jgi:hypothetical protein
LDSGSTDLEPAHDLVWLVWLRTWVEDESGRHIVPSLLAVCSSLALALETMVRDGTSTWTEPVALDVVLSQPPAGGDESDHG